MRAAGPTAIWAVVFCLLAASPAAAISLAISNADFNVQPPGGWGSGNAAPEWTNRSPGNNEASAAYNHSGSGGSLKIWAGAGIYVAHEDTTVEFGGAIPVGAVLYRLRYWAYTPSGDQYTGTGNMHVEWKPAGWFGPEFASRSVYGFPSLSADTWTLVDSGIQEIPSGGPNWRFVFEQVGNGGGGAIYLDDVELDWFTVPEPGTLGLVFCSTLVLAVARKLRRTGS